MNALAALFPDEDFRFRMTMRRGRPADFFRPWDGTGGLQALRRTALQSSRVHCLRSTPEGDALLPALHRLAAGWKLPPVTNWQDVGEQWEPDVLLLSPDGQGHHRLRGGAVCFPTGWALEEKIGRTLGEIHGVVPGLNPVIGDAIHRLLGNLQVETAMLRDNWGIAATDALDLHPRHRKPSPRLPVRLDRLWLRVEHQALVALPGGAGVLFGIRIALHRLDALAADPMVARGLARALRSMPDAVARYKGLDVVHGDLANRLAG